MNHTHKTIIEKYLQAYNGFDVPGMVENLHEEVVFENSTNGVIDLTTIGIDAFRQQAEAAQGYFTQREQKATFWQFEENVVTVQIEYAGVLAVELPNGLKPGDTLRLEGKSIFEFQDGRIIKIQDVS
ncbi:hypothetical protein GCM10027275_13810 [Rhabdobacter roseus]|uniref:Ketosteroid isomerase-like protein n=1 Tax=Rhabdobacter roseus TaxID=1655419 RepID=A0A840TUD6_9BACT|nr:nuclear transport factor 2 family protein [Rhabdobacter roseus]MBB5283299.1 ketosteroid isomerase-like protein [Rhabdobacter roseus]